MEKKRLFALFLALCLLTGMLAGCGSSSSSDDTEETAEETTEEAADEAEEETEEAEEEAEEAEDSEAAEAAEDTEEAEETAEEAAEEEPAEEESAGSSVTYPLVEETETLTLFCTSPGFMGTMSDIVMEWTDYSFFDEVEALTNVHIEFDAVSFEYFMNYFNIYISAGDYSDMIINIGSSYSGGLASAYDEGVIVDLTPYLEEYAPDYYTFINSDETLQEYAYGNEGKVLDFISAYDSAGVKNGNCVRGDWMEQIGMDDITTVDDMHEYLTAALTEFGAEVPFYLGSNCSELMTAWGLGRYDVGGGDLSFYVVDGEIRTAINQDTYKEYLLTMKEWYAEGLIYQDFATSSAYNAPDEDEWVYSGTMAMWSTQLEGLDDWADDSYDDNFVTQPIANITLDGSINHCVEEEYVLTSYDICISEACENIELAVQWLNFWYTEEGIMMYNYGVEGETWNYDDEGNVVLEDFVINNEYDTDISTFLRLYCPYGSFTGVFLRSRLQDYSSELQSVASTIWSESTDSEYVLPTGVSLTTEQNENLSAKASDIMTYADSCIPKFILGDMDIETEWDTFLATMESMGLSECIAIEQEAYDAYIGG